MLEISPPTGSSTGPNGSRSGPAVDLVVLDRLIIEMGMPRPESLAILVQTYLEQADGWIGDLTVAARDFDVGQVVLITHTLGSSSALIGALGLADLLAEAGRLARSVGGAGELVTAVKSVEVEYQRVASVLHGELTGPSAMVKGE